MMGTKNFQFGPGKAKKIGFKDVNLNYEVIVIMDFSMKGRPLQIKFPGYVTSNLVFSALIGPDWTISVPIIKRIS